MRRAIASILLFSLLGCGDVDLKGSGETCVATSECEAALTCDYGQVPAVCASSQSGQVPPPDAAAGPDAAAMGVDAGPRPVDAALPVVDAAPPPDAALDAALDAAPDAAPAT